MKLKMFFRFFVPATAGVLSAGAATLTFDANTGTAGAQDGAGAWNAAATNWWNGAANTNWTSAPADSAIFGAASGAAGTVDVENTQTVAGITFNAPGSGSYVLTNGQLTLSGAPVLQMNVNGTIASTLAGATTVLVQGPGTLTLNGSHLLTGNLRVTNSTLNFGGQAPSLGTLSLLGTNVGTANLLPNSLIRVTSSLHLGDADGGSGTINQSGGAVYFQGGTNLFRVAHWPRETSVYNLSGGLLQALTNRVMFVGWDGVAHFNQSGGTSQLYGIQVGGGDTQTRTNIATYNLTSGRIELGAGGLRSRTNATQVNLGGGTFAASASFASAVPLRFTGTNGTTEVDVTAGATMTLSGILTGTGGIRKVGSGTLLLTTSANTYSGGIIISNGIVAAGGDSANNQNAQGFGPGRVTILTNGQMRLGGNAGGLVHHYVTNPITLDGGTIFAIDGGQHLTNATIAVGNGGGTLLVRYGGKDLFLESPVSGTGPLTVNNGGGGSGVPAVWFFNNNNPYGGTVTVAAASALLGVGRANVLTNATVNLVGSNAVTYGALAGGTAVFGSIAGAGFVTLPTNALVVGGLNKADTFGGGIGGASTLVKIGTNSLTLSGSSPMTGTVRIDAGSVVLQSGASLNSATVQVNTGAVLDVTALAPYTVPVSQTLGGFDGTVTGTLVGNDGARVVPGSPGRPGTLTVANDFVMSATFTNWFDLTNSTTIGSGINDLLNVNGDLASLGSTIAINPLAPLVSGTYRLMNYGTMTPGSFTLTGNTARDSWNLDTATTGQINLVVTQGVQNTLVWLGAQSGDWDAATSNWYSLTTTQTDRFYNLDNVLFDDTGATADVVNVTTVVRPTSVTVSTSSNYTLTGAGEIADFTGLQATLSKTGSGVLTIRMTNSYSAGTTISGGTVLLSDASGRSLGLGPVSNAATLVFNNSDSYTFANDINGAGTLLKDGAGTVTLTGTNAFTGDITVAGGALTVSGRGAFVNHTGTLNNNGIFTSTGTNVSTFAGRITGTGSLYFAGSGTNTLSGTNDFTGGIYVTGYLSLNTSNGVSIPGVLTNQGWIMIGSAANQFSSNTVVYFPTNGTPTGPSWGVIELDGYNQTVRGLVGGNASWGYVQAAQNRAVGTTGTLTIATMADDNFFYSGNARNQNGVFGITKTGTGTQTLTGAGMTYSGGTVVNEGALRLESVTGWGSAITNNALVEIYAPGARWNFPSGRTFAGGGTYLKTGTGTVGMLNAIVTASGTFNVVQGKIQNDNNAANWNASKVDMDISSGAIVDLYADGITVDQLTGTGSITNTYGNGTNVFEILTIGSDGGSSTFNGTISDSGRTGTGVGNGGLALVKAGTGVITLAGTNSYFGPTTISNGALTFAAGSLPSNSARIVLASTSSVLDVTAAGIFTLANFQSLEGSGTVTGSVQTATASRIVPGAPAAVGSLMLANDLFLSGTTTNVFDLNIANTTVGAGVNDLVAIGGNFEPSNSVVAVAPLGGLLVSNGTYRLFNYSGAKNTTFNTNVVSAMRKSFTLDETIVGEINLVVSGGVGLLRWNPLVSSNWNTTEANWQDTAGLTNTTFITGDNVLFDDVGGFVSNVNLAATLLPLSVTVNSSSNYQFVGAGKVSGPAGILKDGAGMLSIGGTANDYTGEVIISNGVLRALVSTALGSTAGVTTVRGAGALDVNGLNLGQEVIQISGTGFGGNGTVVNSGAQQTSALQYMRLLGDASVGGNNGNRWDIRAGTAPYLDLNGYTLTKVGTNFVGLVGTATTNAGDIVIAAGVLGLHTTPTVMTGPGSIFVVPGGALDIYNSPVVQKTVVLNGGTLSVAAAGTIGPQIVINTNSTIATTSGSLTLTNSISGPAGFTKTGGNSLVLTGSNTYEGTTTISAGGTLQIGANSAGGNLGTNAVVNNGALTFQRSDTITVANAFSGIGSITHASTGTVNFTGPLAITGGVFGTARGFTIFDGNTFSSAVAVATRSLSLQGASTVILTNNPTLDFGGTVTLGTGAGGNAGHVVQYSGTWNVRGFEAGGNNRAFQIGEYPNGTNSYTMHSGSLWLTNGLMYLPWNAAQGIWNIYGGTAVVRQIQVNSGSGGNGTLNMEGGLLSVGPGGIQRATGSSTFNIGGATITAYTNWASNVGLNLTGTNGPALFDTSASRIHLSGVNTGTGDLVKVGSGTLVLAAYSTITNEVVVNAGTLVLSNTANSGASVIGGSTLTINPGATVVTYVNSFGLPSGGGPRNSVVVNGGTLMQGNTDSHLRTVTLIGGTMSGAEYRPYGDINVLAASNESVISSALGLNVSNITFNVAAGASTNDLRVNGLINGAFNVIKAGPGQMSLDSLSGLTGDTLVSNGTLALNGTLNNSAVHVSPAATLTGTGTARAVINSGTFAPGNSIGLLTINQSYTQTPSGTYSVELAGATAYGTDYDTTLVAGTAELAGALVVTNINGFTPAYGDTFQIMIVGGGINGTFTTTNLPALPTTNMWNVDYTSPFITLSIIEAPAPTGYAAYSNLYSLTQGETGDDDGDGYANLFEYVTGSNPTNGSSANAMSAARTNGNFALRFLRDTNTVDATLIIEGAYSPSNNTDWIGFATNLAGSWGSATNVIEDSNNPANVTAYDVEPFATNRFLRLRITRP